LKAIEFTVPLTFGAQFVTDYGCDRAEAKNVIARIRRALPLYNAERADRVHPAAALDDLADLLGRGGLGRKVRYRGDRCAQDLLRTGSAGVTAPAAGANPNKASAAAAVIVVATASFR
jgi:hypothetical protein